MKDTLVTIGIVGGIAGALILGNEVRAENPYIDKGTHFELPIVSQIPQGERVEIAKDRAEFTLRGWNDEYAIKITPQLPTASKGRFNAQANKPLFSNKMEYKRGNATAFIEPRDNPEEFDIDFTLDTKPDTNVFEYVIEGAEDFNFFYQPALTQEEIDEGASRPENVIGSYAVYHKTKANHRVGSTNYATGKAFHIYRPKAIDANGAEEWAELNYENGNLTVTVPQSFLDSADYPVVVDPTFGIETVGGTSVAFSGANVKSTSQVTLSVAGDISKLTIYNQDTGVSGGGGNCKGVVYDSSAGNANALKGTSNEVAVPDDDVDEWKDYTFAVSFSLTAADYFLGITCDGAVTGRADSSGTTGTGVNQFNNDTYSDGPTDPFGTPSTSSFEKSIYATYTATPPNPQSSTVIFNGGQTTITSGTLIIP